MAFPSLTLQELICCVDKLRDTVTALTAAQPAFGTATLVDGEVDVVDARITDASVVVLSYNSISGTPGTLSAVLDAGVGFKIESSSGSDDSDVNYSIKY